MRLASAVAAAALLGVALVGGAAGGTDLMRGEGLYREGYLVEAARLGRSLEQPAGYTLAAKATLVIAVHLTDEDHRVELLELAAADARAALRLDPDHLDAHLQLAIAVGHTAEASDALTAHFAGLADEAKQHIDRALELAPDDPWANGLLGIWHLRLVGRGTAALAEQLYGATEAVGLEHCQRAVRTAMAPAVHYGCAVSLLELDAERHHDLAVDILSALAAAAADDLAARLVRLDARRLLARLKKESTG